MVRRASSPHKAVYNFLNMDITFHNPRDSLYELSEKLAINYYKIEQEFPNIKKDDARLTCYSKCTNIVEQILFSRIFEDEQLKDSKWFEKIPYIKSPTEIQIKTTQDMFDSYLRVSLVTIFFSSLETFLRTLQKELFPKSKENQIYKIIEIMLENFDLKYYQRIFDLYRFLRNSLHNNGIITDKHTYPILYNGIWYNFELGKPVQINWLMLCQVTSELEDCLNKIIHNEKIMKIEHIQDSSYFEISGFSHMYYES